MTVIGQLVQAIYYLKKKKKRRFRLKPIQVTHYDGQPRKKQAAPLPPVQIEHETESLTRSGLGSKETIAPVIVTSQPSRLDFNKKSERKINEI